MTSTGVSSTQQAYGMSYPSAMSYTKTTDESSESIQTSFEDAMRTTTSNNSSNKTMSYEEMINLIENTHSKIYEKIKNGDTETSYQIGGTSFTEKEWDKLVEKIDESIEDVKEAVKEEIEQSKKKAMHENVSEEQIEELLTDKNKWTINGSVLYKGALFSSANSTTGESVNVFKSDKFSEDNAVYVVKGTDKNGNEYEQEVDVSKVNPDNCSYIELVALNAHIGTEGSGLSFLEISIIKDKSGTQDITTNSNYMSTIISEMKDQKLMNNLQSSEKYKNWIDRVIEYLSTNND